MNFSVDLLPFIIGGFFNMILGALWYSNLLFAKPWMKEAGISMDDVGNSSGMGKVYGLTLLSAFFTSYLIGFILVNFAVNSVINGLLIAILLWVGSDLPMIIKNWGFEGHSIKLGLINHGYQLVAYLVIAVLYILL